jgi:hypothetical protein
MDLKMGSKGFLAQEKDSARDQGDAQHDKQNAQDKHAFAFASAVKKLVKHDGSSSVE